jgi:hypothetical protein
MLTGLVAAGVLIASTLGIYATVKGDLDRTATAAVEQRVQRAEQLFQQLARLEAFDAANFASERAHRPSIAAIPSIGDETERRKAAFTEVEAINATLEKDARRADIVAVLDAQGKVVARDLNPNAMYGEDLKSQHPAVAEALKGNLSKDIWNLNGRMTRVAIAPIQGSDGKIVGALLVGHVLSLKEARSRRDLLGTEVAYFHGGKVQTSSFVLDGGGNEDSNKTQALTQALFNDSKMVEQALTSGRATTIGRVTLDGQEYAAVISPIPGNVSDRSSGAALLASLTAAKGELGEPSTMILVLGLIGVLVALVAAVVTAKRFITPLDRIELGVAEIINGNIDYTFKPVGSDFEGLSNSLNVMLARLLGREEPNEEAVEEEDNDRKWKAEQMVIEAGDGAPAGGVTAQALAQESEAAYYPRLYNEYVAALRAAGQPAEGVSVQMFTAKLRLVEGGLRQKWNCRAVRFQLVNGAGGQPVFRAVRID